MKLLLKSNPDPNENGIRQALHYAVENGDVEFIRLFLESETDPNGMEFYGPIIQTEGTGYQAALHSYYSGYGHVTPLATSCI